MQTDTLQTSLERRTGGPWTHTGRLVVRFQLDDGTLASVTLPDDWLALVARVSALEAQAVIDAIEDLKYGN
jgi:hypothetical protein